MSMIRQLLPADWRAAGRLRAGRHTHAGAAVSEFTSTPMASLSPRYQHAPHAAFGSFDEQGKLTAYICCYAADDFWVLDLTISSGKPTELHACLDACLAHYEAQGVMKFYYAFPQKWARAYRSFWRNGIERLQKYTIKDIQVIEANKRPPEPWIWEHIMHEYIAPVPLLLRQSYVEPPHQ